jgi:hypothetical protein
MVASATNNDNDGNASSSTSTQANAHNLNQTSTHGQPARHPTVITSTKVATADTAHTAAIRTKSQVGRIHGETLANHVSLAEKNSADINARPAHIHVNVSVVVLVPNGKQQFANIVPFVVHASVPHMLNPLMSCNYSNGKMVGVITATARFD